MPDSNIEKAKHIKCCVNVNPFLSFILLLPYMRQILVCFQMLDVFNHQGIECAVRYFTGGNKKVVSAEDF